MTKEAVTARRHKADELAGFCLSEIELRERELKGARLDMDEIFRRRAELRLLERVLEKVNELRRCL